MQTLMPRGNRYKLPVGEFHALKSTFKTRSGFILMEEALYLLEKGQIRLLQNGAEMSIQELFGMVNLDYYIVYSMFRDSGYRLTVWEEPTHSSRTIPKSFTEWLWPNKCKVQKSLKLTYNLYKPGQKLSGPPDYQLLILPTDAILPQLSLVDSYNVLLALVNGSDIQILKLGSRCQV
jgi:hypothetical protein